MGLYVIGNFEALRQSGTLLESVVTRASEEGILGDALPLCCQNHPREAGIMADTAKNFKKVCVGGGGGEIGERGAGGKEGAGVGGGRFVCEIEHTLRLW